MISNITLFTRPFYFLRHGETELNERGLIAGSIETDLTALGRRQAADAAEALAREPITGIFSSPLRRARDTATPIAQRLGLPVAVIAEIAERNWGVLEGQPRGTRLRGTTPGGGETSEAYQARVLAGLARINCAMPLIVAHSGIYRVLSRILELPAAEVPVTNALPLKLEPLAGGTWKLTPLIEGSTP